MKKCIFLFLGLGFLNSSWAQFQSNPTQGNPNWNNHFSGAVTGDRGICAGTFVDTAAVNLISAPTNIKGVPFIIINTSSDGKSWRRNGSATKWDEIKTGTVATFYNSDGTLTSDRVVTGANHLLSIEELSELNLSTGGNGNSLTMNGTTIDIEAISGSENSSLTVEPDHIDIKPYNGMWTVDSILNKSYQNTLLGWTSTAGANRGELGYVILGSGVSLSGGVLSGSGGTVTSVAGTANQIASTGGTTPVLSLVSSGTLPGNWNLGTPSALVVTNASGTASININGTVGGTTQTTGAFTTATASTSVTSPLIIGGSGTTQTLIYKTTTGVGAAGADHIFLVGNNGATEAMRILNNGNIGIGTNSPTTGKLVISAASTAASLSLDLITTSTTGQATANFTNASGQVGSTFKTSASYVTYKTVKASDFGIYNGSSAGDMVFLNDFSSGKILFGGGGLTVAPMQLSAAGILKMGVTGITGQIDLARTSDGTVTGSVIGQSSGLNLQGSSFVTLGIGSNNGLAHSSNGTWMGKGSISNISATALVHIAPGTATANTAPLKFSTGVILATPEAGVLETNSGNELFYSTSTTSASRGFVAVTRYVAKTANYTATSDDYTIHFTSGTSTFTLPTAVGITGRIYVVRNDSGNTLTLATTSSQTINGAAPGTIATGAGIGLQSTGANWITISSF